ncbi:putative helicase, partial [Cardiosporidium cionae]
QSENEDLTVSERTRIEILCLSAEKRFHSLVKSAHAIMLLGGTLEPREEFVPLHALLPSHKIFHFSSPHVVPPEQILACAITASPSGKLLDFRHGLRETEDMLFQLGYIIGIISGATPGGNIVFFASYYYLDVFCRFLNENEKGKHLKNCITSKKCLFVENRANACRSKGAAYNLKADSIFHTYSEHLKSTKGMQGAVLFCVMNGRLSEGINFSDELARCVIVIGLPFPNQSLQLTEMIKYYDRQGVGTRKTSQVVKDEYKTNASPYESFTSDNKACTFLAGTEFKSILCMKTVNQCIGRAIRHKDDYAAILLLDQRYSQAYFRQFLPTWIRSRLFYQELNERKSLESSAAYPGEQKLPCDFSDITKLVSKFFLKQQFQ